jgi:putative restriction endonuclease
MTPTDVTKIDALSAKFRQLQVWSRREERAPHKPLLILLALGKLQAGADRLLRFNDIEKPLTGLLSDFGPPRRSPHPEYPFWRLRNDGIWEVPRHSELKLKRNSDPLKSELLGLRIEGGFPEEIYTVLSRHPEIVRSVACEVLAAHFPDSLHESIANAVGIVLDAVDRSGDRDPAFRSAVLSAWRHTCAFCGFSVQLDNADLALEAAHIRWVQAGGPDARNNGIACCCLHHQAFDRGAISVADDLSILVSTRLHGHGKLDELFLCLSQRPLGKPAHTTARPRREYLRWHREQVFRGEPCD